MEQIKAQLAQAYAQEFLEVRSLPIFSSHVTPLADGCCQYVWMVRFCLLIAGLSGFLTSHMAPLLVGSNYLGLLLLQLIGKVLNWRTGC